MNRPFLMAQDIADIWTRLAGKAVSKETVLSYMRKSRPGGRYAGRPMRQPTGHTGSTKVGSQPYWLPDEGQTMQDLVREFEAWWEGRPGPGRPRKDSNRG